MVLIRRDVSSRNPRRTVSAFPQKDSFNDCGCILIALDNLVAAAERGGNGGATRKYTAGCGIRDEDAPDRAARR